MTPEEVAAAIKRQRDTCRFDEKNAGHIDYGDLWVLSKDRLPHETGLYYVTRSHPKYGRHFTRLRWVASEGIYHGSWKEMTEGWEVVAWLPYAKPYVGNI